ncbi:unnamed protein product, partial [Rotaria sp. Silwood2]
AKMLKLLLSKPSVTGGISDAMSVYGQIDSIAEIINSISFPSTTYRQPRDIRLFRKFKGNELRIILLFGYSAFENFLDQGRYNHLKVLAFIAHIVEGQCLSKEAHKEGTVAPDSTAIIQPSQITQKLAFRPIFNDDPSVLNTFLFCQYPNLKECS